MKRTLALLLALCMIFALCACGKTETPAAPAEDEAGTQTGEAAAPEAGEAAEEKPASNFDGTLRVGISDSLGNFLKGSAMGENYVGNFLVYDCIFYHDTETKEVYSDILEDFYYEDDTTFVMKLKDNVTFSNGEKATSEDILFSFLNYAERRAMTASIFATVDPEASYCEDELTAVVKFTQPWGPGVYTVDPPLFDKSWCEEVGWDSELWMTGPVGSGPYKVVDYVTDSSVTLELRDDYWGDETMYNPAIKKITVNYYPEISTLFIDLQNNAIDLALNIAEADYARGMKGIEGIAVDRVSTYEVEFLCMDIKNQYLQNEDLRKAIAYGVDWNVVADAGFGTLCDPATSIINSNSPFYKEEPGYSYDPDKAQEYLKASGYDGQSLTFKFVAMADADQQNMAEAFQYYMSELGITVNVEFYDFGTALQTWLQEGGTDFNFQESATGSPSAETYISLNALMVGYGAFPITTIDDDEFNAIAARLMGSVDTAERKAAAEELQDYAYEHALVIPMLEGYYAYGYNSNVIESCDFDSAIAANLRHVTLVG